MDSGRFPTALMLEPEEGSFANSSLAKYLEKYFIIIPYTHKSRLIDTALKRNGYAVALAPYAVAMYETALCYEVYKRWGRRPPLFAITDVDRRASADLLRRMGVPPGAWYVCVHARAGKYSPADEHWHSHRNVDIVDYGPAMDLIAQRGGWCIRMGDPTMPPMPARERCVDYALSDYRSARADIALIAGCRFFLGCASGLYNVAAIFGRPSVLANMTPLSGAYGFGLDDLAIPQSVADSHGRILAVNEIFETDAANFRLAEEFAARALIPTNVRPEAIAELTAEMLDRLDGRACYTREDDAKQEQFRSLLRRGHYAFGTGSRIGRDFLSRHLPS